ncbi:thioesterase II family protein [Actinokineospora inagensis]|uniref:thioesterase II family protein n=1 Tax=Actinokineospora inagensis TaxID=103730 RepID=UPI00041F9482|nr:alpha/beta fold hydrolase [Actinokineospora inagensis]
MTAWFPRVAPLDSARVRLVCLGGAGTGASEFSSWRLPDWAQLWAALLPGRERRIRETPAATMAELADPLVLQLPSDNTPWVIYGHSFGALVGYELAHRAESRGLPLAGLVVAGSVPPHLQAARAPVTTDDDETLLRWVLDTGGADPDLLSDHRFATWLAEDLRTTLRIRRAYPAALPPPLTCPILTLGGANDPNATAADLEHWQHYTVGKFTRREIGEGHFFPRTSRVAVVAEVVAFVDEVLGSGPGACSSFR